MTVIFRCRICLLFTALLVLCSLARAQEASPHAIDIPAWFTETFLDFREDVRDAARDGKRVMIYFGQDGCPYCKQLMQVNFRQKSIVDKTRARFVAIALNLWGDREVTWVDGRTTSEKELARALKVQFTPTLLFLDEKGEIVVRLNGYHPPNRFEPVLDYVAQKMESKLALADYLKANVKEAASDKLHDQPFFMKSSQDLRSAGKRKPLIVLFETRSCAACDELHTDGFKRASVRKLIDRFDVARFSVSDQSAVTTPGGERTSVEAWARALKVTYTPTLVFFDSRGAEVFRVEGYVRPFHLESALDYVASGAYAEEPSFQRFIQTRADRMRQRGDRVELWK